MKHEQDLSWAFFAYLTLSVLLFGCGANVAQDENVSATQSVPAELSLDEWQAVMSKTPVPKTGCFHAAHPSTSWDEVQCVPPPQVPMLARPSAPSPHAIELQPAPDKTLTPQTGGVRVQSLGPQPAVNQGGVSDFMAAVAGRINQVVGTFPSVTGLTSEADDKRGAGAYSLQINSNFFSPGDGCMGNATCQGHPGCSCVQQYLFSIAPDRIDSKGKHLTNGAIYMQYWLKNYGSSCPSSGGWVQSDGVDCFRNSGGVPMFWIDPKNLQGVRFIASAYSGGNDTVTLVNGGNVYAASEGDYEFQLAKAWTQSEFNIFGEFNSSSANFNSGTTLVVRQSVTSTSNGFTDLRRPTCFSWGITAERNNLGLAGPCCTTGGYPAIQEHSRAPTIQFFETNAGLMAAPPYCLAASLNPPGVSWPIRPGGALDIGVGTGLWEDAVWIVGTNNIVFKWIPSANSWLPTLDMTAIHIAVQADGVPWVIRPDQTIYQRSSSSPTSGSWIQRPGTANDIGVGADGSVWIVGTSPVSGGYGMFKWNGATWIMDATGRGATRIAVDATGKPWIVDSSSQILQRTSADPLGGSWQVYPGGARDIGVGPEGYPWIIGTTSTWGGYNIFAWDDRVGNWIIVAGGATQISVGANSRPWITNAFNEIFQAVN